MPNVNQNLLPAATDNIAWDQLIGSWADELDSAIPLARLAWHVSRLFYEHAILMPALPPWLWTQSLLIATQPQTIRRKTMLRGQRKVSNVNLSLFVTGKPVYLKKSWGLSSVCRITSRGLGIQAEVDGDGNAAVAHCSGREGIAHVDLLDG
jgi:hypothetical protein